MAVTNWITETSIDPVTGGVLVTITVAGPSSERFQQAWVSAAPSPSPTPSNSPNAQLSNPAVLSEAALAAPRLLAAVAAKTAPPILQRIGRPR